MVGGWLGIALGFGSVAYGLKTGNLGRSAAEASAHAAPEKADGDSRVFIFAERFIIFVGSGMIILGIGGYLRGTKMRKEGGSHVA